MLALLVSVGSQAGLRLVLSESDLSLAERQATQVLLDEALQALPPRFKQQLDRRVKLRWRDLPAGGYGRAGRFSGIGLNAPLLPAPPHGRAATARTERPHGSVRRELLATVLHELTHLYDRAQLWSPAQKSLLQHCRQSLNSFGPVGLPDDCRGQPARRFTLSDDPQLLDLAATVIGQA